MSHKKLRPFIGKVSVLGTFPYMNCIYMFKIVYKLYHPIILNHFTLTYKKRFIPGVTVIIFNHILNIIICIIPYLHSDQYFVMV